MSDENRIARPGEQDEPADEVEGHMLDNAKVERVGVADEGNDDEVEGHLRHSGPKSDAKTD
jgi:hypothetical protein